MLQQQGYHQQGGYYEQAPMLPPAAQAAAPPAPTPCRVCQQRELEGGQSDVVIPCNEDATKELIGFLQNCEPGRKQLNCMIRRESAKVVGSVAVVAILLWIIKRAFFRPQQVVVQQSPFVL